MFTSGPRSRSGIRCKIRAFKVPTPRYSASAASVLAVRATEAAGQGHAPRKPATAALYAPHVPIFPGLFSWHVGRLASAHVLVMWEGYGERPWDLYSDTPGPALVACVLRASRELFAVARAGPHEDQGNFDDETSFVGKTTNHGRHAKTTDVRHLRSRAAQLLTSACRLLRDPGQTSHKSRLLNRARSSVLRPAE